MLDDRNELEHGSDPRPWIALCAGDPAGIGPELVAAALADESLRRELRLLAVGPEALRPAHVPIWTRETPLAGDHGWLATPGPERWTMGAPQAECGRAALEALRTGAELAAARRPEAPIGALVSAPVSKEALHLAGERVEGQTELLARWDNCRNVEMMAVAGKLRVLCSTRHMALRAALDAIDPERLEGQLHLLDGALREFGIASPQLALAGLNPHAGEGGLFGHEEGELLVPVVERARAAGLDVTGPVSPDTVFLRGFRGEFDAVLALYHDQAFIPVKLAAPDEAFTVLLGLSYLRLSPAHGTAFDIAGRGQASPASLFAALRAAARWAPRAHSEVARADSSA